MSKESITELEEERRLLYVAITRAEKRCTLSYASSRYRNGQTTAPPPSRFLKDLDFQYINDTTGSSQFREVVAPQTRMQSVYTTRTQTAYAGVSYNRPESEEPKQNLRSMRSAIYTQSPKTDAESKTNDALLQVGTRISHDRFGEGEVLSVSGAGDNRKIEVEFKNVGKKTLLLKFARYTII